MPGQAATSPSSQGSFELRAADKTTSVSFATPATEAAPTAPSSATASGDVYDNGSGGTTLRVNVESSFRPYAEFALPDVRALQAGAVVDVAAEGSVRIDAGYCNFKGVASLTIGQAVGSQAPSPQFVTADFVRSGNLVLEVAEGKGGGLAGGAAPDCTGRLVVHATVEFVAASYTKTYDSGSCASLGK